MPKIAQKGRKNHNGLEKACEQLGRLKYSVFLLKCDSESFRTSCGRLAGRVTPGMPDRIAAIPPTGRFAGFEFKTGKARLTEHQDVLHQILLDAGAAVYVVRSVDEFDQFIRLLLAGEKAKHAALERGEESA